MDKISVIIPVYKVEEYLDECILSVTNQTYKNLEIILVDDGSPDKCGEICDKYSKIDDRVVVIHKINGGLSDARNKGIEIATGKYISFIDSDDYVDLRYFEILYKNIKENKADISICSYNKFNDKEKIDNKLEINDNIIKLDREESLFNLYGKYRGEYVISCGKLFKSTLFENIRFPTGKTHEDCFVNYKLYFSSKLVVYNKSKLYNYRQRNDSITGKAASENRLDSLESIEEQINFYKDNNLLKLQIECMKCYSFILGNCYIMFRKARRYDICNLVRKKKRNLLKESKGIELNRLDRDFIKAPWQYGKCVEIYWLFIAIRNKLFVKNN